MQQQKSLQVFMILGCKLYYDIDLKKKRKEKKYNFK